MVIDWLDKELEEYLAELRSMSVLFISIAGINYAETDAVEKLHTFMRVTQEIVRRYEGSINKLAVDDKGTVSIILFGAPRDVQRKCEKGPIREELISRGLLDSSPPIIDFHFDCHHFQENVSPLIMKHEGISYSTYHPDF